MIAWMELTAESTGFPIVLNLARAEVMAPVFLGPDQVQVGCTIFFSGSPEGVEVKETIEEIRQRLPSSWWAKKPAPSSPSPTHVL